VKTRIVRIGNSRGVRLPKPLIEEAGLGEEVELRVVETGLLIERTQKTRAGWADAAALMHKRGEDVLLDEPSPTDFDVSEWVWE
jgi:antitoxin MazE